MLCTAISLAEIKLKKGMRMHFFLGFVHHHTDTELEKAKSKHDRTEFA
jgi:hypothetical protein